MQLTNECKLLVQRLRQCDLDEICSNPTSMLKYYPIRDPDSEMTVFDEIYCILDENLMKKTFKFRIFYFLNIFLSSSKVPAYIIAAYIKRLSRLTLGAKPRSLVAILRLVNNLFMRHPVLMFLRNRVDDKARELELTSNTCTLRQWLEDDPFIISQTSDLKSTRAMDSCIWELMPLRFHEHKRVAGAASFLSENSPPEIECDLDDLLR